MENSKAIMALCVALMLGCGASAQTERRPWEDWLQEVVTREDAGEAAWEDMYEQLNSGFSKQSKKQPRANSATNEQSTNATN